jgi:hypothetical protein
MLDWIFHDEGRENRLSNYEGSTILSGKQARDRINSGSALLFKRISTGASQQRHPEGCL